MSRQSFIIDGRPFRTKSELEKEAKRLRNNVPLNIPLNEADKAFVIDLFTQLYPKDEFVKKGMDRGIESVCVIFVLGDRCFSMRLATGLTVEPSLRVCFNPSLAKRKPTVYATLRYEVFDQIRAYRDAHFQRHARPLAQPLAPCELTGKLISAERGVCEVDHIPPWTFRAIVDAFLQAEGLASDAIPTIDARNGFGDVLADRDLAQRWKAFHKAHASLRVLSHDEHVRITQEQLASTVPEDWSWLDAPV